MTTLVFPILNPNTIEAPGSINQIDFFSNRNINRQLSYIRDFNRTQDAFLNEYNGKSYRISKCNLYKKGVKDMSIQTPSKPNKAMGISDVNINENSISNKKVKSYIEKDNLKFISPNKGVKSDFNDLNDEQNPNVQLYQSIFKINEERKEKKKHTLLLNKDNKDNYNNNLKVRKKNTVFDPLKYSQNTKREMKEMKEKLKFLKGVVNYVFPHYLRFKIEPLEINKRDNNFLSIPPRLNTYCSSNKRPVIPLGTMTRFSNNGKDINHTSERKSYYINEITI